MPSKDSYDKTGPFFIVVVILFCNKFKLCLIEWFQYIIDKKMNLKKNKSESFQWFQRE